MENKYNLLEIHKNLFSLKYRPQLYGRKAV